MAVIIKWFTHSMEALFLLTKKDQGLFMSFTEEAAFRDSVRKMVARHVAPIAAEIDETDRFPSSSSNCSAKWVSCSFGYPRNTAARTAT